MERYEERVDKANNKQQKQDIPILTVIITTTSNTTITTTVRGKATSNSTDNSCTKAKRLPLQKLQSANHSAYDHQ